MDTRLMNRLLSFNENLVIQNAAEKLKEHNRHELAERNKLGSPGYQRLMAMPTDTPAEREAWWKLRIEIQDDDRFKDDKIFYCTCTFAHENIYAFKDHVCIPGVGKYHLSAYELFKENEESENAKIRWKRRNMTILLRKLMLDEKLSIHTCTINKELPHKYMNDCHMQLNHFLDDIELSVYLTNTRRDCAVNIIHNVRSAINITFDKITTDLNITFDTFIIDDNPYTLLFMKVDNNIFPLKMLDRGIKIGNSLEITNLSDYSLDYVKDKDWRVYIPECGI